MEIATHLILEEMESLFGKVTELDQSMVLIIYYLSKMDDGMS